jgi:glycosyltransferase involved in cell wall biosynthesis
MRVLHVYKDYHPILGGIENHIRMLATGQARRGLDVIVLVTDPTGRSDDIEVEGIRLIRARRLATVASTPLSLSLFLRISALSADITHLHFPYPPGEVAHLLLGRGRRTVITYHSDVIRQRNVLRLYRPLLWQVLRRADRIIATSPQYVKSSPYLSRVAHKCEVVPLGVSLDRFSRPDSAGAASLRSQHPGPLLLFVGRLRYYKGLDYLIDALRDVQATLLVVGSGPMEAEWRRYAESLSWGQRIVFCGEVPDESLPAYYQACDVFVLPASERSEAFGAVQIEAMASGKPVVSTELGTGTSFVNRDGETGFVVPARDPLALASAINSFLRDDDLRRRMGEAARIWAHAEFAEDVMVDRVIEVYRSISD